MTKFEVAEGTETRVYFSRQICDPSPWRTRSALSIEVQPPDGVGEDFVPDGIGVLLGGFEAGVGTRGSEHVEAVSLADGVDAEHVGAVTDDDEAAEVVGPGDHRSAARGFRSAAAMGLGNDDRFGDAAADEVTAPDFAF